MSKHQVKFHKRDDGGLMLYSACSFSGLRYGSVSKQWWPSHNRKPWLVVLMNKQANGDGNHYGNLDFRKRRQAKKALQKWGSR